MSDDITVLKYAVEMLLKRGYSELELVSSTDILAVAD